MSFACWMMGNSSAIFVKDCPIFSLNMWSEAGRLNIIATFLPILISVIVVLLIYNKVKHGEWKIL